MNWDRIEGNWKSAKGKVREQWGKLTDDELDVVAGKRDQLAGLIQERYGKTKEAVETELADYESRYTDDSASMDGHDMKRSAPTPHTSSRRD
jgi:uncharacterized protein YjbJ (UPF0337 family)